MRGRLTLSLAVCAAAGVAWGAMSADIVFEVLPAETVLPPSPDAVTAVTLEVAISTAVDGMQGWSLGILCQNSGAEKFFIANAYEHPDLATFAGAGYTGGTLVPGRPSFDTINYYTAEDLVNYAAQAEVPNLYMNGGFVLNDSINGVPGEWAAVTQGVVLDLFLMYTLPASENFGALAIELGVQGEAPASGSVVFSDAIGSPPTAVVAVFGGYSYPPSVAAPAEISFAAPAPRFIRGDFNANGVVELADMVSLINYLTCSKKPLTCLDAGDVNDNGAITMADPLAGMRALLDQKYEIPAPFPACGEDPTADDLGCESFAACP